MICLWTIIQLVLYLTSFATEVLSGTSLCDSKLKGTSSVSKRPGRLNGHIFKTHVATRSVMDCVAICSRDSRCASANYVLKNQNCELNDQTKSSTTALDQFVLDRGTEYFEIKTTWLQWGAWGGCSSQCGDGTQTRTRTCCGRVANPSCVGNATETKHCFLRKCPTWLQWGGWGACSAACGNGVHTRTRVCDDPVFMPTCDGVATETNNCYLRACPTWLQWGGWGACSATCNYGVQTRTRVCDDPVFMPTCNGVASETRNCYVRACPPTYSVRLVNGGSYYGRVEVYYNNQWGTVCDDSFDAADARVVCRQLGLSYGNAYVRPPAYYGQGSGNIWMDNVACSGSESALSHCGHRGWGTHDCNHGEDVSVVCV